MSRSCRKQRPKGVESESENVGLNQSIFLLRLRFLFLLEVLRSGVGGSGRVLASVGLVGVLLGLGAGWSVVEPAGVGRFKLLVEEVVGSAVLVEFRCMRIL